MLVARNSLFREGLLLILRTTAFRVCKVAATIDDLSLQPTRTSRPFLFLIGTGGDHAVTVPIVERGTGPSARTVVLSDRCELNDALAVFRAGADGYLFEQISRDALIKSLDLVMLGVTILPAALMRLVGEDHEMDLEDDPAAPAAQTEVPTFDHMPRTLSQREMGIFRCLMQGEPNKTIARRFEYHRGDRQSPHQGDPSEDLRPQSHSGGCLGAQSFFGSDEYRARFKSGFAGINGVADAVTIASKAQHRVGRRANSLKAGAYPLLCLHDIAVPLERA